MSWKTVDGYVTAVALTRLHELSDAQLWPRRPARDIRNELGSRHLPMARRVASRFRNPHEAQEDLNQVASMALVGAVDRFDAQRGTPFAGFAVPTIIGEVKKHFRSTAWALHVPRAAAERAQAAQRGQETLTDRLGRAPTIAELAEFLGLDLELTVEALDAAGARYAVSLDAPRGDSSEAPVDLVDLLGGPDGGYDLVDTRLSLRFALRRLPFAERSAVVLRAEHGLTQAEIGQRLGCSQMQVSRLLSRATLRLGAELRGVTLEDRHASVA